MIHAGPGASEARAAQETLKEKGATTGLLVLMDTLGTSPPGGWGIDPPKLNRRLGGRRDKQRPHLQALPVILIGVTFAAV